MEYLDIFDAANQPLNQWATRSEVHERGLWHRTAQVFVRHPEKGYLCHRRSRHKDLFPSLWDISIGGHLAPRETYAARELEEELGIAAPHSDISFLAVMPIDGQDEQANLLDREHAGIFLYHTQLEAQEFSVQREEIDVVQYLPLEHLQEELVSQKPVRAYISLQTQFLEMLELVQKAVLENRR